eukprot:TRINITY_DN2288_c0_g1_i3.p3 TRINITY_DN2288_c0_g1~~TRINITY_DN2288_c0_g1_i3.p3  ORF type:complete len:108 (+),score=22.62 TRINITY_DN2288_c0_g1_i3:92-415(+)
MGLPTIGPPPAGGDVRNRGPASKFYETDVSIELRKGATAHQLLHHEATLAPDVRLDEDMPRGTLCPGPRANAIRHAFTRKPPQPRRWGFPLGLGMCAGVVGYVVYFL